MKCAILGRLAVLPLLALSGAWVSCVLDGGERAPTTPAAGQQEEHGPPTPPAAPAAADLPAGRPTPLPMASPTPQAGVPVYAFVGSVGGAIKNCGITEIRGTVWDAAGKPIDGRRVRVAWPTGGTTSVPSGEADGKGPGEYDVVLDAEAKDGVWSVGLVHEGGERLSEPLVVRTTRDCTGPEAANTVLVNFRLSPAFVGSVAGAIMNCGITEIRGTVRDAAGRPLNGERVRVTWPTGRTTSVPSGADGRAAGHYDVVLDAQAKDGTWHVWAVDEDGRGLSPEVVVRTTRDCTSDQAANTVVVDFRVIQTFRGAIAGAIKNCGVTEIRGTIQDAVGNPVDGRRVRVSWPTGRTTSVPSGEDGRAPGRYDVVLDAESKDGVWRVWMVDPTGRAVSNELEVRTTGDCTGEGAANTVLVDFQRLVSPGPTARVRLPGRAPSR